MLGASEITRFSGTGIFTSRPRSSLKLANAGPSGTGRSDSHPVKNDESKSKQNNSDSLNEHRFFFTSFNLRSEIPPSKSKNACFYISAFKTDKKNRALNIAFVRLSCFYAKHAFGKMLLWRPDLSVRLPNHSDAIVRDCSPGFALNFSSVLL